jgi:AcrR family transcriptional regulator
VTQVPNPPNATAAALTDNLWADVTPEAARRLLAAAIETFSERGYHATTTRDIAARAAMSPAGVYIHYPTKEDLLYRIVMVGHQRALEVIQDAVQGITDPAERVAALVRTFARWYATHRATARVITYEMSALTPRHFAEVTGLRRQIERIARDTVAQGVSDGVFTVPDVPGATRAVLSLIIDIPRWFGREQRQTADQVADLYAALTLQMLGRTDPGRGPANPSLRR